MFPESIRSETRLVFVLFRTVFVALSYNLITKFILKDKMRNDGTKKKGQIDKRRCERLKALMMLIGTGRCWNPVRSEARYGERERNRETKSNYYGVSIAAVAGE